MDMLERLAVTAELRDDATGKHCFRVGRLAMLLAQRAGLPQAEIDCMDLAARLHDIGKFAIPDAILLKPGRLDAAETRLMRTHTTIGADLLAEGARTNLHAAERVARHHHEFWDGDGYPLGLAREQIPVAARITALADVYDALSHLRPYKPAWSHTDTMAYIRSMRGIQFDPHLTDLFVEMMVEAESDLSGFLASLEDAASASPFIVAERRMAKALKAASAGS
jgi:putative two-component system response regulator